MQPSKIDRWLGACLTLFALFWLWLVLTYVPDIRSEGEPGPRGFPLLLGVGLAVLGVFLASQSIIAVRLPVNHADRSKAVRLKPDTTYAGGSETIAPVTRREAGFAGGTFALLILYAFLLDKVGFIVSTPVVTTLAMFGLLRMRKWLPILSLAVGFTFGCWLIFDALLGTPLPRGTWLMWL